MSRTRRSFLRAAVVSPVIAAGWVVWETETGRLKVRQQPVACCVSKGVPNRSCTHPPPPALKKEAT